MHKLLLTTILLAILCGFSCQKEANDTSLQDTSWRLIQLVEGGAIESVPSDVVITATFTADKLQGNGGCNAYNADYTTTGDQLAVTLNWATERLCADIKWEDRYFKALLAGHTWKSSGNTLTVLGANTLLVFTKE